MTITDEKEPKVVADEPVVEKEVEEDVDTNSIDSGEPTEWYVRRQSSD